MGTLVRLKRLLSRTEREADAYECLTCHATFRYQQQVCPECGGYDIRSTEWLDDGSEHQPPEESS